MEKRKKAGFYLPFIGIFILNFVDADCIFSLHYLRSNTARITASESSGASRGMATLLASKILPAFVPA
jgi:hypothetical protein